MWRKKKKEEKVSSRSDRLSRAGQSLICSTNHNKNVRNVWERHKDEETGDFKLVNKMTGETRVLITRKSPPRPSVQDEVMAFRKVIQSSWVERFNEDTGERYLENRITKERKKHGSVSPKKSEDDEKEEKDDMMHTSKYRGVRWDNRVNKWLAYIKVKSKVLDIGTFIDEKSAARAHDRAAKNFIGPTAEYNFPDEIFFEAKETTLDTTTNKEKKHPELERIESAPWTIHRDVIEFEESTYDTIIHRAEDGMRLFAFSRWNSEIAKSRYDWDSMMFFMSGHDIRLWPDEFVIEALMPRMKLSRLSNSLCLDIVTETRRDPNDGQYYTQDQFEEYYGRSYEWDLAVPLIKPPRVPPSLNPDAVESNNIVITVTTKKDNEKEKGEEKEEKEKEKKTKVDSSRQCYYVRVHDKPFVGKIKIDENDENIDNDDDGDKKKKHVVVTVVSVYDMKSCQDKMYISVEDEKTCQDVVREVAEILSAKAIAAAKKKRLSKRRMSTTEIMRTSSEMSSSSTPTSVDLAKSKTVHQRKDDVVTSRGKNKLKAKLLEERKEEVDVKKDTDPPSPRRIAKNRVYQRKRKKKSSKARKAWKRAMKDKKAVEHRKQIQEKERERTNQDIEMERKRLCEYTIERMNRVAGLHRKDKESFYRFIGLHLPLEMRSEWYVFFFCV